jgi:hypothetical protein
MEQYIAQLIEDLNLLAQQPIEPPNYALLNPDHPALEPQYGGMLDYIVSWECGTDEPMEKVFGIAAEAFPPYEQLTEAQATQLCEAILNLWAVNRLVADIPEGVPPLILYKVLRQSWEEDGIKLITDGSMHREFCNYFQEDCPWGIDYCRCKDFDFSDTSNEMDSTPIDPDALLF